MKFVEVCGIMLAALFLLPAAIGLFDELTGVISNNLELPAEMELVLEAYPLFLIAFPIVIVIMLFRRRRGEVDEQE